VPINAATSLMTLLLAKEFNPVYPDATPIFNLVGAVFPRGTT